MATSGKSRRNVLLPTPSCADVFTDNLKSSQQADESKHSVNLSQALNHPYYNPGLLPTPKAQNARGDGERHGAGGMSLDVALTCLPEAFPANPSPKLDDARARQMTASSGRKCSELYARPGPLGSLLKMLLASSRWTSRIVQLEWVVKPLYGAVIRTNDGNVKLSSGESTENCVKSGTKPFGWLFQLAVSGPVTDATGCGLLPTAQANKTTESGEIVGANGNAWNGKSKPHSMTTGKPITTALADRIAMLPTPATRDYKGANGPEYMKKDRPHMDQLPNAIAHGQKTGMKLHPAFVEWMMGYPPNYTSLEE